MKLVEIVWAVRPDLLAGLDEHIKILKLELEDTGASDYKERRRALWLQQGGHKAQSAIEKRLLSIGAAEYNRDKARVADNKALLEGHKVAIQRLLKKRGLKASDLEWSDSIILQLIVRRGVVEWCVDQYRANGDTPSKEGAQKVGEQIGEPYIAYLLGETEQPPPTPVFRWLPGTVIASPVLRMTSTTGRNFGLDRASLTVRVGKEQVDVFHLKQGDWDVRAQRELYADILETLSAEFPAGVRTEWE